MNLNKKLENPVSPLAIRSYILSIIFSATLNVNSFSQTLSSNTKAEVSKTISSNSNNKSGGKFDVIVGDPIIISNSEDAEKYSTEDLIAYLQFVIENIKFVIEDNKLEKYSLKELGGFLKLEEWENKIKEWENGDNTFDRDEIITQILVCQTFYNAWRG